jgi:hypothetical protein
VVIGAPLQSRGRRNPLDLRPTGGRFAEERLFRWWRGLVAVGRVQFRTAAGGRRHGRAGISSATRLAADGRDRRVGCLELLDHFLARAERHNTALNAVVAWQIEVARDRARGADAALARGEVWGPLHGVPMTVKESFNITGLPTTWGNDSDNGNSGEPTALGMKSPVPRDANAGAPGENIDGGLRTRVGQDAGARE